METKEKIKQELAKMVEVYNQEHRKKINLMPNDLDIAAEGLANLAEAINNGHSVFGVCEKRTSSLDRGYHYFSIYYTKNNQIHKLCLYELILLFDGKITKISNKNWNMPKYVFCSDVIGIDRLFEATHFVFYFLSKIKVCPFFQINCLN